MFFYSVANKPKKQVTPGSPSVFHVFSLTFYGKTDKRFQGCTRRKTFRTFSFYSCHMTVNRNSFDTPFRLMMVFHGLCFSFVVYVLDLFVMVCFVFIVLVLEFPGLSGLLRWISSTILVVPPYLFLCMNHLPMWHMMSDLLWGFISFCIHYSFYCDIFIPSVFSLFYSDANKHTYKGATQYNEVCETVTSGDQVSFEEWQ